MRKGTPRGRAAETIAAARAAGIVEPGEPAAPAEPADAEPMPDPVPDQGPGA